ncbi:MAG: 23S rRNA (pseudouridine(1915)-N(3))-methyltransferase RlmH [Sterolibacteriaceae bacterium]|jgi:23S rRNA (pseudouridine1915-N3)-methyltransferase|nr:23S rRNA (pseudouridine(1915)-N(3))-methyltransferase RlmH [Candidatus Methylophosphatis haderslevensis]
MKLVVCAVGTRMPAWVDAGFDDYARRMPRELPLTLAQIRPEPRNGKPFDALLGAEESRIRAALPQRARLVALDERGDDTTTRDLAARLEHWQTEGDDVAFVIGGPDGLAAGLKRDAHETLRLSSLTLPHALVRVVLAEALYRAWSVTRHHPYHRE